MNMSFLSSSGLCSLEFWECINRELSTFTPFEKEFRNHLKGYYNLEEYENLRLLGENASGHWELMWNEPQQQSLNSKLHQCFSRGAEYTFDGELLTISECVVILRLKKRNKMRLVDRLIRQASQ
jgi:hypothetical protein